MNGSLKVKTKQCDMQRLLINRRMLVIKHDLRLFMYALYPRNII